jgi:hypothetical protein
MVLDYGGATSVESGYVSSYMLFDRGGEPEEGTSAMGGAHFRCRHVWCSALIVDRAHSFGQNGQSPAKRLFKLKADNNEEDAHNVLADLRSLEMLIYLFSWHLRTPTAFFTADRNLALFWCGQRASNFESGGRGVGCTLAPAEQLLPGAGADQ